MAEITVGFQTLSQEVVALSRRFKEELGLGNVASILEGIQKEEKDKLQLVSAARLNASFPGLLHRDFGFNPLPTNDT